MGAETPATARFGPHHRSCLINTRSSADTRFIPRMSSSPQFIWVKRVFPTSRKRTTQFLIPSDFIKGIKTAVPPACQATRRAWRPPTTGQRPCRGSPPLAALVSRTPGRPPTPAFYRPGLGALSIQPRSGHAALEPGRRQPARPPAAAEGPSPQQPAAAPLL